MHDELASRFLPVPRFLETRKFAK